VKHSAQRGFVLLAGLALLALASVALLGVGYSANLLVEKRRATDLADAASLSVASWYAQAMNYQAYANRAIAANEIMIAQSITALSWMRHAQKLSENSGQLAGLIPGLAAANQWFQQSVRLAEGVVESAARAEIPARSAYTRALLDALPGDHPSQRRAHVAVRGDVAQGRSDATGCRFATRCPHVQTRCLGVPPPLSTLDGRHQVACIRVADGSLPPPSPHHAPDTP
jgi:oligopeptide/dipeptide ABC transporter ATP-binding protein